MTYWQGEISDVTATRHKDGSVTWVWEDPKAHHTLISREALTGLMNLAGYMEMTVTTSTPCTECGRYEGEPCKHTKEKT